MANLFEDLVTKQVPIETKERNLFEDVIDPMGKETFEVQRSSIPQYMKYRFTMDRADAARGSYGNAAMAGRLTDEDAIMKGDGAYEFYSKQAGPYREMALNEFPKDPVKFIAGEGAQFIPYMVGSAMEGTVTGLGTGAVAAGTAFTVGQLGPQVTIPEEVVTVPSAFIAWFNKGFAAGVIRHTLRREGGNLYLDLRKNNISAKTAKPIAIAAGTMIGALEVLQFKYLGKAAKQSFAAVLRNNGVRKFFMNSVIQYAKNLGVEVAQEDAQEIVSIMAENLAGTIENQPELVSNKKQITDRLIETTVRTVAGLAPIVGVSAGGGAVSAKFSKQGKAISEVKKEISREEATILDIDLDKAQNKEELTDKENELVQKVKIKMTEQKEEEKTLPPPSPIQKDEIVAQIETEEEEERITALSKAEKETMKIKAQGRLKQLESEIKKTDEQISLLESQRADRIKSNQPVKALDNKIESLLREADYLDSQVAEILQSTEEGVDLTREKVQLRADEVKRIEKRIQEATTRDVKAEVSAQIKLRDLKIQGIKDTLAKYVKDFLPRREQGRFLTAIKDIQTSRQLELALARLDVVYEAVEKQQAIQDLRKTVNRATTSPSIAIEYIDLIKDIMDAIDLKRMTEATKARLEGTKKALQQQIASGQPVTIPRNLINELDRLTKKGVKDLTADDIKALNEEILAYEKLGRTKIKLRRAQYQRSKEKTLNELKETSTKISRIELKEADVGESLSVTDLFKNKINSIRNLMDQKGRAITPTDVLFDILDGTANYLGKNYKIFKKSLDVMFGKYLNMKDEIHDRIVKLAMSLNLDEGNFDRIGVWAAKQQEGGNQKLLDTGLTQEQIDRITLTPNEMTLYEAMRSELESLYPKIAEIMRVFYNKKVQQVKNYFSFLTDFEAMTDYEMRERFGETTPELKRGIRKNVYQKFVETRVLGKQRIKLNAMEVFLRHTDNVAYLLELGPEIKRLQEIAGTQEYKDMVGDVGQQLVREWLDLMARKGGAVGDRLAMLDWLRKNAGLAVMGFKLSSTLVQFLPLIDASSLIGHYSTLGLNAITNRTWRQFIKDNFPEISFRIADDPAYLEFGGNDTLDKIRKYGFWALQKSDVLVASAVAAGAYLKYLNDHNIQLDLTKPNEEAIQYAQLVTRRTQSSAFFKDAPAALTQGKFSGNKSVDKMLFQFQSFMLNRWSLIQHDMWRAGILGENKMQAMNIAFFLTLSTIIEVGMRRMSREFIDWLTGDDEAEEWDDEITKDFVLNLLQNIPFVSQTVSAFNFGSVPVPTISLIQKALDRATAAARTKNPDTKLRNMLRGYNLLFSIVFGIPGAMQVDEFLRDLNKKSSELEF